MAGHEAAASILQTLFGQNQLGAPAPAFNPGEANFDALQLGNQQDFSGILQAIQRFQPQSIEDLIGPPQEQGQELAAQTQVPVTSLPSVFNTPGQNTTVAPEGSAQQVGPQQDPQGPSGFGAFFGNLDQNLQSPSKLLGLSLLSQLDPRLAQLGLLGGGLFGQNKVF